MPKDPPPTPRPKHASTPAPAKSVSSVALAIVAVAITIVSSVVAVTVSFTMTSSNVAHLQDQRSEDKAATGATINELKQTDQQLRRDFLETQRRNAEVHQALTSTTVEIKTYLKVLSEERAGRRR